MNIEARAQNVFQQLKGELCCRKRVGRGKSLSLGFGAKIPHVKPLVDSYYGTWEIGTYESSWRLIKEEKIILGGGDLVDSTEELDERLQGIEIGSFQSIEMISRFDIRLSMSSGINLEIIGLASAEDELFHMFAPNAKYLQYMVNTGWILGASNSPWK